ncbi:MAG: beta-N-acetylhexosaminidase [Gammaproteobacteria bacterium]
MALGPLMLDLHGPALTAEEREQLCHPAVGGVILFSRNYVDREQLRKLVADIHGLRDPPLLTAVDHEGGAVQRFRNGFTPLPACAALGRAFDRDRPRGLQLAEQHGWLMAAELRTAGVDLSFAPVLDVGLGVSRVINDRAFHRDPEVIALLASAYVRGMHAAGMAAVGKHFPGHGSVAPDSHHELPVDPRPYDRIRERDLVPFERLIRGGLEGIMPAHVVYTRVDARPSGFSSWWLNEVLRGELGFQGTIFSDDISMSGAACIGDFPGRARAALAAGCDMVLLCNSPDQIPSVLRGLEDYHDPVAQLRLVRMHGRAAPPPDSARREQASAALVSVVAAAELALGDDYPA